MSMTSTPRMLTKPNQQNHPALRFTPYAWAKLLYLRDRGETEVGAFGIASADNLLLVVDLALVPQVCTAVTVAFDDAGVADYFDAQIDAGKTPAEFARIWIHTHPGDSPLPSQRDEATFARVFGPSDWAVMFILAQGGQAYARLRFSAGPGGELELPVELAFDVDFPGSAKDHWEQEYLDCVQVQVAPPARGLLTDCFAAEAHLEAWLETFYGELENLPSGGGAYDGT